MLSMGTYAGIRNVVAHSVEPGWSEQQALEYLAVRSTVARWTSETDPVIGVLTALEDGRSRELAV